MAIVGGTHLGHLLDRGKKRIGFFDRATIAREKALYHDAKRIISHSAKVSGEIVEHYDIAPGKITTLYPPVDTENFLSPHGLEESGHARRLAFRVTN